MNRRNLLAGVSALALGGCASFSTGAIATDVSNLSGGLQGMLVQIGQIGLNIPTAIMSAVGTAIASLQKAADAIAATYTTAQALPLVQQVAAYVNAVVAALTTVPSLPSIISGILTAAQAILPIIEAAVGMLVGAVTASPMSPSQARAILAASATYVR